MPRPMKPGGLPPVAPPPPLNPYASEFIPLSATLKWSSRAEPSAEAPARLKPSAEGQEEATAAGASALSLAARDQRRMNRRGKLRREALSYGLIDDESTARSTSSAASARVRRGNNAAAARRDERGRALPRGALHRGGNAEPIARGYNVNPAGFARQSRRRTSVCGPRLHLSDSTRRRYDHTDERTGNELSGALQDSDSGQIRTGDSRRRRRRRRLRGGLLGSGGGDGDGGEGSSPSFPPQVRAPRARGGIDLPSLTSGRRGRVHHNESAAFADRRKDSWIHAKEPAIRSSPRDPRGVPSSGGEQASGPCVEVPPIPEEEEEDFPALPLASSSETRSKPLLPQKPPEELPVTKMDALNYASVKEKLSADATVAAPRTDDVTSSDQRSGAADESFRRLIVLPGFREDRRSGTRRNLDGDRSSEPKGEGLHPASSLQSSGTKGDLTDKKTVEIIAPSWPQLLAPAPPQPTLAAGGFISRRSGATAAIAALRSRLRERWFRLEAMRKAERQRVVGERSLMAAEDRESMDREIAQGRRTRESGATGPRHRAVELVEDGCGGEEKTEPEDEDSASSKEDIERGDMRACDDDGVGAVGSPRAESDAPSAFPLPLDGTAGGNFEASSIRTVMDNKDSGKSIPATWDAKPLSAAGAAAIKRAEVATFTAAAMAVTDTVDASPISPSRSASNRQLKPADSVGDNGRDAEKWRVPGGSDASPCDDDHGNSDADFLKGGSGGGGSQGLVRDRMHAACESGMAWILNDLLVRTGGRAADGKDKLRRTPLHLAAEAGSLECVNLLLKQGTRLDQRDRWRETPLHKAARVGNADVVKALCTARMKVNVRNRHRETPLLLAVRAYSTEVATILVSFGARPDDADVDGITPVCQAAMDGQGELLMIMANSNQACRKSSRDATDPHMVIFPAAEQGGTGRGSSTARRRSLASSGRPLFAVAPNSGGEFGRHSVLSPVHEAAAAGQVEMLSLLLQLGVSFEERDSAAGVAGDTPLGRAVRCGRLDCARLLLDSGAMIGRENLRGETPLVIAIRAGQASAVELLVTHGAPLDGGRSQGHLISADGRAPAGAREKMLARRRSAPLEVALREGQLACAAVLIEGGARINMQALRTVKLEPASSVVASNRRLARGPRVRYVGSSSPVADGEAGGATRLVALQTSLLECLSPDVRHATDTTPLDGGGLQSEDFVPAIYEFFDDLQSSARDGVSSSTSAPNSTATMGWMPDESGLLEKGERVEEAIEWRGRSRVEYIGCRMPALGECDVVLVLEDGSRLPVHSCLLAAFSGAFRDLFLHRRCCRSSERAAPDQLSSSVWPEPRSSFGGTVADPQPTPSAPRQRQYLRSRAFDVQALLSAEEGGPVPPGERPSAVALAAAAVVLMMDYSKTVTFASDGPRRTSLSLLRWGRARGEILVRFWGSGTMAALVAHVYSGCPPDEVHADGLGRLLAAAVSLRMPRLTRQVEHLLSATVNEQQRGGGKSAQHGEVARLLRGARSLGAADLESRCTLHLQANGSSPAVMKLRRQLSVPSLNASDVTRGLARLRDSGYLGSGSAYAWSSGGAARGSSSASAVVKAAKRAVDLSLRKRAVDFDQLVPLLVDPPRCMSTLSIGRQERAVLLMTALTEVCSGHSSDALASRALQDEQQHSLLRGWSESCCCDALAAAAAPLASNFAAFSHGLGWLLRTGAVADVALVLPAPGDGESFDSGEERAVTKESDGDSRERFLAHSVVLGARSEKFAAMLRFMRRQDDAVGRSFGDDADADGDVFVGDGNDDDSWSDCGLGAEDSAADGSCAVDGETLRSPVRDRRTVRTSRKSRPRRDPPMRELELHSPLLSPRSLVLFLEFLYTGVLDPGLSAGELSELALIADEYLVPDLTLQAEALLVEYLELHTVEDISHGFSSSSSYSSSAGQPGRGGFARSTVEEDDVASTPFEALQLGVSLGMRKLSVAAARAVLLRLETVSRSEAFEASGMTKRDLVVAALEAARS